MLEDCPITGARGFCEPEGKGSLGVLILGESLGDAEAHDGLPFRPYAPAGSVLERAIRKCGYSRDMFVLWNVVPTQPPRNWLEGAPWEMEAVAWGAPYLRKVIDEYQPRSIFAVGNVAARVATGLAGDRLSVSFIRGYPLPSCVDLRGVTTVCSFHPSYLRQGSMSLLPVLEHDLKLAVATAAGGRVRFLSPVLRRDVEYDGALALPDPLAPVIPPGYLTHPTESEAWAFYEQAKGAELIAYDIETPCGKREVEEEDDKDASVDSTILSCQFSLGVGTGIFMPWRIPFDDVAKRILVLPNLKGGANNWRFDNPLLRAHGCQVNGKSHDVRWAWHHLQPDLPASLQFIASFYAREFGPWKHWHQAWPEAYGIADCDVVQRIL